VEDELDEIRNRMEETRASLSDKLEALEDQLRGTVEGATSTVSDTVESVKGTMETVKESLDVTRHVQRRPWLTLGGAFAIGYLAGSLLPPRRRSAEEPPADIAPAPVSASVPTTNGHGHRHNGAKRKDRRGSRPATPRRKQKSPVHEALEKVSGLAVGSLMGVMRRLVTNLVPDAYVPDATRLVDRMTTKLGGKPLPETSEAEETYSHPRSKGTGYHG
jgi:ElaB/YqjD/DUF883 family membrane-anchored ribosome-binding protein